MSEIKIYTIHEVAELLKTTKDQVYKLIKDNKIVSINIGQGERNIWRVTEQELNNFLNSPKQ